MTITLEFKQTTVALTGNPFGRNIFNAQVLPIISGLGNNEMIEIVFPSQIKNVTSSFIQGFFDYWLRTMTKDEIKEKVIVLSDHEKVVDYIWKNVRREEC